MVIENNSMERLVKDGGWMEERTKTKKCNLNLKSTMIRKYITCMYTVKVLRKKYIKHIFNLLYYKNYQLFYTEIFKIKGLAFFILSV